MTSCRIGLTSFRFNGTNFNSQMLLYQRWNRKEQFKNTHPSINCFKRNFNSTLVTNSGVLHHEWIIGGKVVPENDTMKSNTVIFLHGLLGNSKVYHIFFYLLIGILLSILLILFFSITFPCDIYQNLRGPAKRLTAHHPHTSALLLDLRGHGNSTSFYKKKQKPHSTASPNPHTISSSALDIIETLQFLGLTGKQYSPVGVVGHSFGGRCALQYLHTLTACQQQQPSPYKVLPPKHTWLLDTVPGVAHKSVDDVFRAICKIPRPISSKKELVRMMIEDEDIDPEIAAWMTTNLYKTDKGFDFIFDLDVVKLLLNDFPNQDFIGMLSDYSNIMEKRDNHSKIHMVIAGKNRAWTDDILLRLKDINCRIKNSKEPLLDLVFLENAGHWVHIDDLDGLMNAMNNSFE